MVFMGMKAYYGIKWLIKGRQKKYFSKYYYTSMVFNFSVLFEMFSTFIGQAFLYKEESMSFYQSIFGVIWYVSEIFFLETHMRYLDRI